MTPSIYGPCRQRLTPHENQLSVIVWSAVELMYAYECYLNLMMRRCTMSPDPYAILSTGWYSRVAVGAPVTSGSPFPSLPPRRSQIICVFGSGRSAQGWLRGAELLKSFD